MLYRHVLKQKIQKFIRGGYLTPKMGVLFKCSQSVSAPIGYS